MKKLLAMLAAAFLVLPALSAGDVSLFEGGYRTYSEEEIREYQEELRRIIKEQPENKILKEFLEINPRTPEGQEKASILAEKNGVYQWRRERAKEFPELQGVDLGSPEGIEKLLDSERRSVAAHYESESVSSSQGLAQAVARIHFEYSQALGMTQEEFDAIEPLLERIENLRNQNAKLCSWFGYSDYGFKDRDNEGDLDYRNPYIKLPILLGVAQPDPTIQEIQNAGMVLQALVGDRQANATELAIAIARLCKARQNFYAVYAKAEGELRAVLTPLQEAVLVASGTLR